MSTMTNEEKLLEKCLKGNTDAFEVIVSRYQDLVCAITYSGTSSVQISEELAHQTFVNAWKNLSQLKDPGSFRGWLCIIARNIIRNYLRQNGRDIIRGAKPMDSINDMAGGECDPLESAISKEHAELVGDAIGRLPERYRDVFVLFYRQGQSIKGVAESLDLSEDVVKQRLFRGRKMIKERLGSIVEQTLGASGPKKAFTAGVVASVAGLAVKGTAAAAGGGAVAAGGGTTITSVMSGLAVKVAAVIITAAIGVGVFAAYDREGKETVEELAVQSAQVGEVAEVESLTQDAAIVSSDLPGGDVIVAEAAQIGEVVRVEEPVEDVGGGGLKDVDSVSVIESSVVLEPEGVLCGFITDVKTGEPVTDAMVTITPGRRLRAKTDEDGFYHFDEITREGKYKVSVSSEAYLGSSNDDGLPEVSLSMDKRVVQHFELEKACMIEVSVRDETGEPFDRAEIIVSSLVDDWRMELCEGSRSRFTDAEGYVLIGGLRPLETEYLLTVRDSDYAPGKLIVKLSDPYVIESGEVVMEKGVRVKGYAEYADGVAAAGVKISAEPDWWNCYYVVNGYPVDANGFFELEKVASGGFNIQVHIKEPGREGTSVLGLMKSELPVAGGGLLVVKIPKKSPGSLASISGRISFVGDKKSGSLDISAYSPMGSNEHIRIGEDMDTFRIGSLEPGSYSVRFSGVNIEEKVIENVIAPCEGLEVELAYSAKPRVGGRVVDGASGDAVNKYSVRVRKLRTLRGRNYTPSDEWSRIDNDEGVFDIEVVGPGVYQVQVAGEGYAWVWSDEINTDQGGMAEVLLFEGGKISGRVVDEDGRQIDGAKITPLSKGSGNNMSRIYVSELGSAETVNGEFTLANLAGGLETLKVTHPDYGFSIVDGVEVVEGEVTEDVEIVLVKGGVVEGYVYDEKGGAVSNAVLFFQDESVFKGIEGEKTNRLGTAVTDPNGYYRVKHMPEKICHVSRQNSWLSLGVVRRVILPANGKSLRLDFGGGPKIRGKLVLRGEASVKKKVLLASTHASHSGSFRCNGITGMSGEFELCGGPVGQFAVYYERTGERVKWVKVATVDVSGEDIDLGVVGEEMGKVIVTVERVPGDESVISNVYMQEGTNSYWGQRIGIVESPVDGGGPYVISNIPVGKHTLCVRRKDRFYFSREIEIGEGDLEVEVLLKGLGGTASVRGRVEGDIQWVLLWSMDCEMRVSAALGDDGSFKFENLPAGRYSLGNAARIKREPISELELGEGEVAEIELDASGFETSSQAGRLGVKVFDEKGMPCMAAEVWIEVDGVEVEPYWRSDEGVFFVIGDGEHWLHVRCAGYKDVDEAIVPGSGGVLAEGETRLVRLEKEDE